MQRSSGSIIKVVVLGVVVGVLVGGAGAWADFTFDEPVALGPPHSSAFEETVVCFSPDGLEIYLISDRPGGSGDWDMWVAKRGTTDADWGPPENLGPTFNSDGFEGGACISQDGLTLYFQSDRPGGHGSWDIWTATRTSKNEPWTTPVNLGPPVNSVAGEGSPAVTADGLELYFYARGRPGGVGDTDIWVSTRSSTGEPWGEPTNLGSAVNTAHREEYIWLSPDGLSLVFDSDRPGGFGWFDLWITRRASRDGAWTTPVNLGPAVNGPDDEALGAVTPDGRMLYFISNRAGGLGGLWGDIWQVRIIPLVDFNGDGRVTGVEFSKVVDYWGENEPACDVGPTPLGDGIVDVQDLIALAEYIGKDVYDPTLIAHWALDETEGYVAHDSLGENHATVMGDPVWQPAGGVVNGALLLDGIKDWVATEAVRDPSEGPMSVFAWVKGGAPGQVLVSQVLGANWLMADASGGCLMTDLKQSGRSGKALASETIITDGNWHRVGLVWDGTNRLLCIDDVVVAADTQSNLVGSNGGLNIGCDKSKASGTFWSGLIDDVRIYNRAIKP